MTTLPSEDLDRVIEMAWEDRTPFEAIEFQFGLSEPQVIALMRQSMKPSSFKLWRKRVSGRKTKHAATSRSDRFRASGHK
ncbi:MAG: TIGR03643 family protein [Synechococcus sp. BS301-5m-G53]|nr:TIGR03643 family protein [Synechococcus sp. BS301-5m-G53]